MYVDVEEVIGFGYGKQWRINWDCIARDGIE